MRKDDNRYYLKENRKNTDPIRFMLDSMYDLVLVGLEEEKECFDITSTVIELSSKMDVNFANIDNDLYEKIYNEIIMYLK